jgi:hypothetical protein
LQLNYQADYTTKAITVYPTTFPGNNPANFGVANFKAGAPNQRIFELSAKYTF